MSDSAHLSENFIRVTVSSDKLKAYMQVTRLDETIQCTAVQLESMLRAQLITVGVKHGVLHEIAMNPLGFVEEKAVVAEGELAISGTDGVITFLHNLDQDDKKPLEMENGKVDYKEVTALSNVRKGELIAKRVPPSPGTPGRGVTGEILLPREGKEARFKLGKNVVVSAEGLHMYAAIDGMIVKTDRDKINVFPVFEVNGDVDYNIGNIDFVGTVVIRGNVLPGFKVKASGDIRVTGGVEGADMEAGGSIEISAGILGQNKGLIKAGVNVKSSFIQDGNVEAAEHILVSQSIMHSNVRAGNSVVCLGAKGLIVGGIIQAGDKVTARTIGNSMSTNTFVEVGVLPELRNELIQLRGQVRTGQENLDKTEKALVILDQLAAAGQLTPERLAIRVKLQLTKKQAIEEQTQIRERILEIEKSLSDTDKAKVEVLSIVYGGTKIVIGRYTKFVKDAVQRVVFRISDGDISMVPYL
ncbi:DUF342 domain-containing protein [Paenibacillus sp. MBLB4367]|uniref:DUF342 domain-containing protein n=1 Tax=Paenibacillus sp. MBLB4367 TaxID=3384767 RepID=UPI0039081D2F